jgi:hypothetical protein
MTDISIPEKTALDTNWVYTEQIPAASLENATTIVASVFEDSIILRQQHLSLCKPSA